MTFSDFIIKRYSKFFYTESLKDISKANSTLEKWFRNLYEEYKNLNELEKN